MTTLPTRTTRVCRHALALGALAGGLVGAATASAQLRRQAAQQDGGPIIVGQNAGKYNWWDLQWFRVEQEFYGEFRSDSLKTPGQPDNVLRDNLMRETTNLSFESYIGHKNLFDLTGTVKIGYQDEQVTSGLAGGDVHENPFTDFYDVQALILGQSRLPVTVYTRRDETLTAREFASSLRTATDETGAILSFRSDTMPTRLQYFHRELALSDALGAIDSNTAQDTVSLQSAYKISDQQRLEFTYTLDMVDEQQGSLFSNSYDRHDASITHLWDFGEENRSNLRSTLRLYDESGRFEQSIYRLDEQLFLWHSDTLESRYNLTAEDQSYQGAEQRLLTGNASVKHKLFDSLTSTGTIGGSHLEAPGNATTDDVFVSGVFDYTKKVPYGRLDASLGMGFDHQDNSAQGGGAFAVDEQHTFVDPFDVVLARRNIVVSSIIVTDLTHTITFQQGLDYTVRVFPDHVELHREAFGPNPPANNQTVLITYEIGPEPGSQIDTTTQNFSVRYTFNEGWFDGLALYAYYTRANHSVSAVDLSRIILDDSSDFRFGAEYRIWDLSFLAEQRLHDSTISPYDETRLEARWERRLNRASTVSVEFTRDDIRYRLNDDRLELNRVTGRYTQRLARGLDISLYLQYRDERSTITGNIQGFEQAVELNYTLRQTHIWGSFRNSILTGEASDRTSQTFTIGLTRSF